MTHSELHTNTIVGFIFDYFIVVFVVCIHVRFCCWTGFYYYHYLCYEIFIQFKLSEKIEVFRFNSPFGCCCCYCCCCLEHAFENLQQQKTTNKNLVEKVTSYATCIWIDYHYWVASRIVARTSDFAVVRGRVGFKTRFVGHAPLYSFSMDICCMPYIFIYIYHHYIPF